MPRYNFLVTTLSTVYLFSSAMALAQSNATAGKEPVTRDQIPALVREALVNDPSILTAAIDKLQANAEEESATKSKEAIAKRKDDLYSDPTSPVVGAADADVTVIEFFDYHCGYCKQALTSITKLLESDKKVRVVFKEYPILSDDSKMAARAALAVHRIAKDKYFDFHKAMFDVNGAIDEKIISEQAKKLGIDPEKLKKEMSNPEIEASLAKNKELGTEIGALGTPALVIGSNFYGGVMPYEAMQKAIDGVRKGDTKPIEKPRR